MGGVNPFQSVRTNYEATHSVYSRGKNGTPFDLLSAPDISLSLRLPNLLSRIACVFHQFNAHPPRNAHNTCKKSCIDCSGSLPMSSSSSPLVQFSTLSASVKVAAAGFIRSNRRNFTTRRPQEGIDSFMDCASDTHD